jgi:hypothetical protein
LFSRRKISFTEDSEGKIRVNQGRPTSTDREYLGVCEVLIKLGRLDEYLI